MIMKYGSTVRRFIESTRGVVAIEAAFILPIVISIALLGYDAAAVIKQKHRLEHAMYDLGNTLSSVPRYLTCDELRTISELAYESFELGNWARSPFKDGPDFQYYLGSEDFKYVVKGVRVETPPEDGSPPPENLRGEILWMNDVHHYQAELLIKGQNKFSDLPGAYQTIPEEYQIPGEFYIAVQWDAVAEAPLKYLSIFQGSTTEGQIFFSPRHIPELLLEGSSSLPFCKRTEDLS